MDFEKVASDFVAEFMRLVWRSDGCAIMGEKLVNLLYEAYEEGVEDGYQRGEDEGYRTGYAHGDAQAEYEIEEGLR